MAADRSLDSAAIADAVGARGLAVGVPLHYRAQVGSTNDLARDLAMAGAPHGTTVIADEQVSGRGRRGASPWQTPPRAAVALSVVVRPSDVDASHIGRLGLCVALAVAEAIQRQTGVLVGVKWPNDLVVTDHNGVVRKLGGILIEPVIMAAWRATRAVDGLQDVPSAPRLDFVVIGVGVNVNASAASLAPVDPDALPPIAIVDLIGRAVSREALVVEMLAAIGDASTAWTGDVWPEWRARFEARMVWNGAAVEVHADGAVRPMESGRLAGVDGTGALVIDREDGLRTVLLSGTVRRAAETQGLTTVSPPRDG